ncbi:MAG: hypothetical protein PHH11_15865 [Methylomonas sp.]|nr:hypothetical protein [Methylomonas sp.]
MLTVPESSLTMTELAPKSTMTAAIAGVEAKNSIIRNVKRNWFIVFCMMSLDPQFANEKACRRLILTIDGTKSS